MERTKSCKNYIPGPDPMTKVAPLPLDRLHATFDASRIPWRDSGQIPESRQLKAGRGPFQPRVMQALDLALAIRAPDYHVYLCGDQNLGRRSLVLSYLAHAAKKLPVPPDLVYVRNFADPDSPALIQMPPGLGKKFRDSMANMVAEIGRNFERRFETGVFLGERSRLDAQFQGERARLMRKMSKLALEKGFSLDIDPEGALSLAPLANGKKLSEEDYDALDGKSLLDFRRRGDRLAKSLSPCLRELSRIEDSLREEELDLEKSAMERTLDELLTPLARFYAKSCPALEEYFAGLREDILKNTDAFAPVDPRREDGRPDNFLQRYAVNLFVDNSGLEGAPVIEEDNPTVANLLGCMERESEMGALVADLALIRAGALQRANGGFLVLRANEILERPAAWEALLRSLRKSEARLEEDAPEGIRAKTLRPQPLALNVKAILIGDDDIYESLVDFDERFPKIFRVKAHMTDAADRNAANIRLYLCELARIIRAENLLPFDASALAWLIDLGSHLCEDQKKLSLKFPLLREQMIEADALARMDGKSGVGGEILEKSWALRSWRANLAEEAFMEEYDREIIKVATAGRAVGQVNGLSILSCGDYDFGLPHRISCAVGVGHDGIIDLEREAELGGPIHTKAMMILKSYLTDLFASKRPIALSASLHFEQSYGGIEGDSASGAELAALLSALARVPARLDLAFTGAVSHSGQIMAVGGVTRKIEGFYKVCARHGLTGSQGVIIPADNIDRLMLSPEILESVSQGKFAVYPVGTIEDAILLLTGLPAGKRRKDGRFTPGSLYDLVDRRLETLGYHGQNAFRQKRKDQD